MINADLGPRAILDLTEWANLENADGSAFPETPDKLHDLMSGDPSAVAASLDHLNNTLLSDGVVYSATVPAFRYVAALLGDQPSRAALTPSWEVGRFPLRGKLIAWLASVASDVSVDREEFIRGFGKYSPTEPFPDFIGIRNIYPEALRSVSLYFEDSDLRVTETAIVAVVRFLESPALSMHRERLMPLVQNILTKSSNERHRGLASEALNAWGRGRARLESSVDPLALDGYGGVRNLPEDRGSIDEPPF